MRRMLAIRRVKRRCWHARIMKLRAWAARVSSVIGARYTPLFVVYVRVSIISTRTHFYRSPASSSSPSSFVYSSELCRFSCLRSSLFLPLLLSLLCSRLSARLSFLPRLIVIFTSALLSSLPSALLSCLCFASVSRSSRLTLTLITTFYSLLNYFGWKRIK